MIKITMIKESIEERTFVWGRMGISKGREKRKSTENSSYRLYPSFSFTLIIPPTTRTAIAIVRKRDPGVTYG